MSLATSVSHGLIARDIDAVAPAIYRFTQVAMDRAQGTSIWDVDGRHYWDLAAGIATMNVGHCHPRVVEAVREQAGRLLHGAAHVGYMAPYVDLVERLRSVLPAPLDTGKALLVNSGSEAVEAAVKFARMVTGRSTVLAFLGGFHGRPMGALALTASDSGYRRGLGGMLGGVEHVPFPTCARCPFGQGSRDPSACCGTWLAYIESVLVRLVHPDDLAAVFVESVLGEGGTHVPPPDFLPALRAICDRTGALLITDEVQAGMGRTGRWMGFEHSSVVPDAIAVGKAVGGGLPLGGVLGRAELMDRWAPGAHGTTFGGNPLACRAGIATIDIIEEDGLLAHATEMGARIVERLRRPGLPAIGDVRGIGLMLAIELVNADGQPIGPAVVKDVIRDVASAGVIMTKCGQSLLRVAPPLTITADEADQAIDTVLQVIDASATRIRSAEPAAA